MWLRAAAQRGCATPDTHPDYNQVMSETPPDETTAIMTQLPLKAGPKERKGKALDAAQNDLKQLQLCDTFYPIWWRDTTEDETKVIVDPHLFLKLKRDALQKAAQLPEQQVP